MVVQWLSFIFFAVAAVVHILFFVIESVILQRQGSNTLLKLSEAEHAAVKVWAFNQGFYNLFLALGTFVGLYFVFTKQIMYAGLLTSFCGICMIAAGIVLALSSPKLRRWAILQISPPLLGFVFLAFHIVNFI